VKLLVVEDHPIVRSALCRLLSAELHVEITECPDGESAVSIFRELRPDLVILDLGLPGLDGLSVMGQIKSAHSDARVLVVSMYDNPAHAARVLAAGASGYVSKNAPPEQIVEAVRRVGAGRSYIEPEIAQELALTRIRSPVNSLDQMSAREVEILRLLADGSTLMEIAQAIGVSYKTVANQCSQLKGQLGIQRTADLIRLAIGSGFGRRNNY